MKTELAIDLSNKIIGKLIDTALTGSKATVIYFGSAEFSMLTELKALGVATKIQNGTFIHGVRMIRTVETSHCEVY